MEKELLEIIKKMIKDNDILYGKGDEYYNGKDTAYKEILDVIKELSKKVSRVELPVIMPSRDSFGQWISVKDKYPDKAGDYLTYDDYGFYQISHFTKKEKFLDDDYVFTDKSITHWMPLPIFEARSE